MYTVFKIDSKFIYYRHTSSPGHQHIVKNELMQHPSAAQPPAASQLLAASQPPAATAASRQFSLTTRTVTVSSQL
jgi:hypothetical protein